MLEKNQIMVYDNFLPKQDFEELRNAVLDETFPWYFNNSVMYDGYVSDDMLNDFQFIHCVFLDNKIFSLDLWNLRLKPLIDRINAWAWIRLKLNLNPFTASIYKHGMHVDYNAKGAASAVFYLNTNNGETVFADGRRCKSVENRLVLFDNNLEHTGTTCTDSKRRVVVNLNFFPKESFNLSDDDNARITISSI